MKYRIIGSILVVIFVLVLAVLFGSSQSQVTEENAEQQVEVSY